MYRKIDLPSYQGKLLIIGNCSSLDTSDDSLGYIYPVITTTINSSTFSPSKNPNKIKDPSSGNPIKRKLVMRKEDYLKFMVVTFNKILGQTKKEKDQFFMFTHLKFYLSDYNELFFALTNDSQILKLESKFYFDYPRSMENAFIQNFSEINFASQGKMGKEGTFTLSEIRAWMQDLRNVCIIGIISKLDKDSLKEKNAR